MAERDPEPRSPLTTAAAGACALLVGGPLLVWLPQAGRRYPGIEEVDYYGTLWFYAVAERALSSGSLQQFQSADLFFYPYGKDVFLHTGANVLDALLAAPLRWVLGPVAGFNAFLLLAAAFNARAFSRLVRNFTGDQLAVGIGSLWFAASPFVLYELAEGRPTQAIVGLIPLFLLQVWRAGSAPGWRAPALAGLTLAALGYQYWYYAFFGGVVCLAHGLWRAALPPRGVSRAGVLGRHAGIAAVALALTLPVAGPLAASAASGEAPGLLDTAAWNATMVDPVTREGHYVALQTWQPWTRQVGFYFLRAEGAEIIGHQRLLSLVLLAAALLGLARPGRLDRGPVLAMAAATLWLATGPLLLVGDQWLPDPLYQWLAQQLGFLARLWWPGRAFAFLMTLLTLLAAMGLAWAGRDRRLQLGLAGAATLLWAMDLRASGLWPMPSWDASVPPAYRCLADPGTPGALIELPYGWTQAHLYYQTAHWRPLLGGMLEDNPAFIPEDMYWLMDENRFLQSILAVTNATREPDGWTPEEKAELYDLGYRYVVFQKDALALPGGDETNEHLAGAQRTRLRRYRSQLRVLLGSPVYEDARHAIYAPWGDPSPCAPGAVEPATALSPPRDSDTASVIPLGSREVTPWLRLK